MTIAAICSNMKQGRQQRNPVGSTQHADSFDFCLYETYSGGSLKLLSVACMCVWMLVPMYILCNQSCGLSQLATLAGACKLSSLRIMNNFCQTTELGQLFRKGCPNIARALDFHRARNFVMRDNSRTAVKDNSVMSGCHLTPRRALQHGQGSGRVAVANQRKGNMFCGSSTVSSRCLGDAARSPTLEEAIQKRCVGIHPDG